MTKYTITMQFGTEAERPDVEKWAALLMESAPDGTEITIRTEPLVLNAEDVTEKFIGHDVLFATTDGHEVSGELTNILRAGGKNRESIVLVVNDTAWVMNFGVVTITDW